MNSLGKFSRLNHRRIRLWSSIRMVSITLPNSSQISSVKTPLESQPACSKVGIFDNSVMANFRLWGKHCLPLSKYIRSSRTVVRNYNYFFPYQVMFTHYTCLPVFIGVPGK